MATNDISLSAGVRSNLLSLQNTARNTARISNILATGKKVNSALDNPSAFFSAQSLKFRASDLEGRLDGIGQAVQSLKTADETLKTLTTLLESAKSIAQEAADQAVGGAVVNGDQDLDAAAQSDLVANTAIADGDTFTVRLGAAGSPTTTITISTGDTLQDVLDELNNIDGLRADTVAGTNAGEVRVRLQTTNGQDITIANGTNTPASTIFGVGVGVGVGTTTATSTAPEDQTELQAAYNEVLAQIDTLVSDGGYRGANLLDGGSLDVNFNEDGSSTLTVAGVDFTFAGLGISQASGANDFSTTAQIDAQLDSLDTALGSVRAQARTFGTNLSIIQAREDFTKNLVNVLKEGADKLTLADTNEEAAKLLSLQTAQQLGINSLSIASQQDQGILRLF